MEQLRLPNFSPENKASQVFLKPMETFHCAPDDTEYKGEKIDTYFAEVVDLLNYDDNARSAFLHLEYKTPILKERLMLHFSRQMIVSAI